MYLLLFEGWMATLISGGTYNMYWENGVHISNFSFDGEIYGLKVCMCMIMSSLSSDADQKVILTVVQTITGHTNYTGTVKYCTVYNPHVI